MESSIGNTQDGFLSNPVKKGDLVVVVGAGSSGKAAVKLLVQLGARIRLVDKKTGGITDEFAAYLKEHAVEVQVGEHTPGQFTDASLVVTSPGVPLKDIVPVIEASADYAPSGKAPELISELELALPFVTSPIIAVTGTSGKTTTVSLMAAMLEAGGKSVFLGGNIGTPLCSYVAGQQQADVLVLECSSFQLSTTKHLHPRVALLLNLTENHLDQHSSMQEYVDAKFSLFALQTGDDLAIVESSWRDEYKKRGFKGRMITFSPTDRFTKTNLAGDHNRANAEAAFIAVKEFGITESEAAQAVAAFTPLRHRLEKVAVINGVTYVNDSKCTTVEALKVALESFTSPVFLLAGGKFKGGDLVSLIPLLKKHVKEVALYGASRDKFEKAWQGECAISWHDTLAETVHYVAEQAVAGDIVLLSPATSSYDQYKNYIERGDDFCRLVRELS